MNEPIKQYSDEEWQKIMDGLDEEEREILDAMERGELKRSADADEMNAMARIAARNTLRRSERVSLRVSSADLSHIKWLAAKRGVPCGTLLYEIVQKYMAGRLIEKT